MIESVKKKTAIVCSWGGMRCSYTWGFLCGLEKRFPSQKPDIIISASGWAGSASYYLTDQFSELRNIWTKHLANPCFINPYRIYEIMSIDYAINIVLRKKEPLHVWNLLQCTTDWYIPITQVSDKNPIYFSQKNIKKGEDIFDLLMATMSIPLVYGKEKTFYGKKYIDGCIAAPFYKTIERAIELWATHILAIDVSIKQNQNISSLKTEWVHIELVRNQNMPAKLLSHSEEVLTKTFELWYKDAMENTSLDQFLN